MEKKRLWGLGVGVALMVAAILTMGVVGTPGKATAEELAIGHINPLTGPAAPWGANIAKGFEVLAEYYNEKGGLKADGKTWQIKMIQEDNKYQGAIGRAAGEKLLTKDKVKALIGDFVGDSILSYRTLANRNKVPIFIGSSGIEGKLLGPEWPYVFQVSQTQLQKMLVLDIAWDTLKKKGVELKRAASIDPDNSTGRGCSEVFVKQKAPQYKMEVVAQVFYPGGTQDFSPFCTKILAGKPDIVEMGAAGPGDQALIRKTLYQMGYRGYSVAAGSLVNAAGLIKIAGQDAIQGHIAPFEAMECPAIKADQKEIMRIMKAKWEKKWPDAVFEPIGWRYASLLQILVQAYEKGKTLNPDVLKKTLEQGHFDTILGDCKFTGLKTFGIAHCADLITIAGIVEGNQVKYLGYARLTHE